jgi:hypothetical protein
VGVPSDTRKARTKKVSVTRGGPCWEEQQFTFPLSMPELALLAFEAREEYKTGMEDYFVGQVVIPVWELMLGYRAVALKTKKGEVKRNGPGLLCRFEMKSVDVGLSA